MVNLMIWILSPLVCTEMDFALLERLMKSPAHQVGVVGIFSMAFQTFTGLQIIGGKGLLR